MDHEWMEIIESTHQQLAERQAKVRADRLHKDWDRMRCASMRAALNAKKHPLMLAQGPTGTR